MCIRIIILICIVVNIVRNSNTRFLRNCSTRKVR